MWLNERANFSSFRIPIQMKRNHFYGFGFSLNTYIAMKRINYMWNRRLLHNREGKEKRKQQN